MNKPTIDFKKSKAALNFGLPTDKLTLNNINHIYAACRMADGPLPPMNMYVKAGVIYYIDGNCPLTVQDYKNLFSPTSKISQIKNIIKKLSISYDQTNKPTKKYLVTVIKTHLKQSGVIEPLRIPVPKSTVARVKNNMNTNANTNTNQTPNLSANQNRTPNLSSNNQNQNRTPNMNTNANTNSNRTPNMNTNRTPNTNNRAPNANANKPPISNQNREAKLQNIKNKLNNLGANTKQVNIPIVQGLGQGASMFGGALRSMFKSGEKLAASAGAGFGSSVRQMRQSANQARRSLPTMNGLPNMRRSDRYNRDRSQNRIRNRNRNRYNNNSNINEDGGDLEGKLNSVLKSI